MKRMNLRKIETVLARLTLVSLVIYVPVETWVSLPYGLGSPYYLVDLAAMILLFWGAIHSLRCRPRPAPGVLCAAYAWAAANGWRATFDRVFNLREGGTLDYGNAELWAVGGATGLALSCLAVALFLVVRQASETASSSP